MVLRIHAGNEDLARSRFAVSPLWELVHMLRMLARPADPGEDPGLVTWLSAARARYQALCQETELGVLLALQPPGYGTDFLSPVPADVSTTIEDLLARVRATPVDQAHCEITEALQRQPSVDPAVQRILASDRVAHYAADILAAAWESILRPEWPTLRAVLERDVVYRAGKLASKGWAAALADLDSDLSWHDGRIELRRLAEDEDAELGGRGLLFVPSVFIWPRLALTLDPPWPPALIYPARGVAALWQRPSDGGRPGTALDRLLGRSRAAILLALDHPASTSQLTATLGQSLGGLGGHLTVLRDAGLLTRARSGRSVLYRRSRAGDVLVRAPGNADLPGLDDTGEPRT